VRENLKNVLLFMASSGFLVSPKQDASKEKLWTETWKRIDRFLPDLRSDLALEEPEPEPALGGAAKAALAQAEAAAGDAPGADQKKEQEQGSDVAEGTGEANAVVEAKN